MFGELLGAEGRSPSVNLIQVAIVIATTGVAGANATLIFRDSLHLSVIPPDEATS